MTAPLRVFLNALDLTAAPYSLRAFSAPEPSIDSAAAEEMEGVPDGTYWPRDLHDPSTVTMTVAIDSDTTANALAAYNALVAQVYPEAVISAQHSAQARTMTKLIYHGAVSAFDMNPQSAQALAGKAYLTCLVTLTCYPYWVEPPVTIDTIVTGTFPAVVTGPTIDTDPRVPALTELRVVAAQPITSLAVGLKTNAPSGYSGVAVQDYSGIVDALGYGGQVSRLTAGTAWATNGTAPALDIAAARGRYIAWVRAKWSAGTTVDSARINSDITGSGIAALTTVNGVVTASPVGSTFEVKNLGDVVVPAAEVPSISTGAGYGPETSAFSATGYATASDLDSTFGTKDYATVTLAAGKARIEVELAYVNAAYQSVDVGLWYAGNNTTFPDILVDIEAGNSALFAWKSTAEFDVTRAGTYRVRLQDNQPGGYHLHTNAGNTLANIKVWQRVALGFTCHTPVQAKATSGTPFYDLDTVALVPCDECYAAVVWPSATAAWQGILIDETGLRADAANIYLCDSSGGVGTSLLGLADARHPFLLRKGVPTFVISAGVPADAAPASGVLSGRYYPRRLTLSAGA